jgi:hypothetical protein
MKAARLDMRAARLGALRHIRWVIFKCQNRVSFERSLTAPTVLFFKQKIFF